MDNVVELSKAVTPRQPSDGLSLIKADTIIPTPIKWLWDGYLAGGKVHILGGAPGTGKTTIAIALAATITIGGRWPDGTRAEIGNVAIWSGEDDPADTLIPRLALAGADLSRVYFIGEVTENLERRAFDPANDIDLLMSKLVDIGDVKLLIIDPIVSAITGDSHKNAEVRRGLQPLGELAASLKCALLGITHFTKGTAGRDPVERITGSLAFGAVARVVMVVAKQKDNDDSGEVRIFCRAKSNIGQDDGGFEYDLMQSELSNHPGVHASAVLWGKALEGNARDLLAVAESNDTDQGDAGSVDDWLRNLIAEEGGSVDRRDVMKAAKAMGHPERTVYRARGRIGIIAEQKGQGKDRCSVWKESIFATSHPSLPCLSHNLCGNDGKHDAQGGNHDGNNAVMLFPDEGEI